MLRTVSATVLAVFLLVATVGIVPHVGAPRASAQTRDLSRVRVLAVAPFADFDPITRPLAEHGAVRLSALLHGGPFQIIEAQRVAAEMGRAGVRAPDLISPSRTVELGTRLGADAVLTGRVVEIFQERLREREGGGIGTLSLESRVTIDVRILEVGTRLILLQNEFRCNVPFWAVEAMECVVREVAARLRHR